MSLQKKWLYFILNLVIILVCWLPVFLAFFPGICYYDLPTQIGQYKDQVFNACHPLLHTLILGFLYTSFDSPNTGMMVYCILQMILLASSMAYSLVYLYKRKVNRIIRYLILAVFALFPMNPLLAISTTKDIVFAALLLFTITYYLNIKLSCTTHDSVNDVAVNTTVTFKQKLILSVLIVFTILFRNNAIYAFLAGIFLILLYQLIQKKRWLKTLVFSVCTILLYFCINRFLMVSLQANTSSIKEMMSIPSQQMSLIYKECNDAELNEKIIKYIPSPEDYNPWLADAIKMQLPFEIIESKSKHFLVLAAECNLKHPIVCLKAFYYTMQGYIDIFQNPYHDEHFYLAAADYRSDITLTSYIPWLHDLYVNWFQTTANLNFFIKIFFNGGIYLWLFLICLIRFFYTKKETLCFCSLILFFYLGTLLLGPGAIIRYIYPIILCVPMLMSEAFSQKKLPK